MWRPRATQTSLRVEILNLREVLNMNPIRSERKEHVGRKEIKDVQEEEKVG